LYLEKLGGFFPQYLTRPVSALGRCSDLCGSSYFCTVHTVQRRPELRRGQPSPQSQFNPPASVELQCASVTGAPCSEQPKPRNEPTPALLQHQLMVGIQREMAIC